MLPKPAACADCPWYGDGQGFVPDTVPEGAAVIFVGQNPGADEELTGRPFIGRSGQLLRSLVRQHLGGTVVGYANVVKCRRQTQHGLAVRRDNEMPTAYSDLWHQVVFGCVRRHLKLLPDALVVLCGNHARAAMLPELDGEELHVRGSYVEVVSA